MLNAARLREIEFQLRAALELQKFGSGLLKLIQ